MADKCKKEAERRELREAIAAGREVLSHLGRVDAALNSASNWGLWDVFGGGVFVTWAKHSRLNEARTAADRARQACRIFAKELRDVQVQIDIDLNLDGFLTFADYFFDGFFADIMVQSRIGAMRNEVRQQTDFVQTLLGRLQERMRRLG